MPNSDVSALRKARAGLAADAVSADVEVTDSELLLALSGTGPLRLSVLERQCEVSAGLRGNVIRLQGPPEHVRLAERVLSELAAVAHGGTALREGDLEASVRLLRDHPEVRLVDVFSHVVLASEGGRQVTPRGLAQRHYVQEIKAHDIVFGVGPAGTGKTYLAMACAVEALAGGSVRRIILSRPAVEAGERLGFLPGDLAAKVDPYLRPLYDALYEMMGPDETARLMERGTIEIAPLAYMRGRTLNDAFIVLDEAQNTSPEQMKMFLTRLGFNSKMVVTGDVTQVDLSDGRSGLRIVGSVLRDVDGIGFVELSGKDVVRHRSVAAIVDAYERYEARNPRRGDHGADDGGSRR
jgi:phosphate starvation-inducible PhoH-like protein